MLRNHCFSHRIPLIMLTPDNGGGSGGSGDNKPKTLAEAQQALTEANTRIESAEKERDTAKADLATAKGELAQAQADKATALASVTQLTQQFNAATEAATTANKDRDEARTQLATVTTERDTAQAAHKTASENVTRLSALCGVMGIDPNAGVPTAGAEAPDTAKSTLADFDTRLKAAKTPEARAAIVAELNKAIAENKIATA